MESLSPYQKTLIEEILKKRTAANPNRCLWPEEFAEFNAESAWRFVQVVRTWNEATQGIETIPDKEFLYEITKHWIAALETGKPLVIEKCRRMIVSWLLRALELWRMGLGRFDHVLCGIDYDAAASHCWRYLHLYDTLRRDYPDWKLPEAKVIRAKGDRFLDSFALANGSITRTHNQEGGALQGEGSGLITMEEISRYRQPAQLWAQSKILVKGKAGGIGGTVVGVTNASMNLDWQNIKRCA